jgi:hypothetical protein
MKRTLFVVLFFVSCTNSTSPEKNPQAVSSKEALILTYSQSVRDSALNPQGCPIKCIDILFPGSLDSIKTERIREFVRSEMDTQSVILLFNIDYNYSPIGSDIGGGKHQFAISRFPFVCTATKYNGKDSTRFSIDSIDGGSNVFLRIEDKPFTLNRGDSLVVNDTVYSGDPPCQQRIIITKKLNNEGLDSLPNDKYRLFF